MLFGVGMGRTDVHAHGGAGHRSPRWGCWRASTTSARPTPGLASCWRSSRLSLTAEAGSAAAVNVRELRRSYDRRVRLPRALVEELARTTSMAQPEWVAARAANDFGRFRPWLEKIVQLKHEESACVATGPPRLAPMHPGRVGPGAA